MKKYSTLIISVALFAYMIGVIASDIGKAMPGYTVTITHVYVLIAMLVMPFVLGYMTAKQTEE